MSYTPTVWETGDVVSAEKLNNIEQGIAEMPVGVDALIWFLNSSAGYQIYGDFERALAKVTQGIPLVAYACYWVSSGTYFSASPNTPLSTYYSLDYPNQIDLMITGGIGYRWTATGVEYFD